jgi:hypothetical protein
MGQPHAQVAVDEGSFVTASGAGSHPPVDAKEDTPLNNNNNRGSNRRRGRGNNRQQGGGNQGNRIDSRARGNAPQMLEKYRKLAHDASLNGDRVQAEYYLQFADHYFRVIADSRVAKDDQRPQQQGNREPQYDDGYGDDDSDQYNRAPQNNGRDGGRDGARDGNRENGRDAGRDNGRDRNEARRDRDDREDRDDSDGREEVETGVAIGVEGEEFEPAENPFTRDNSRDTRETRTRRPEGGRSEGARSEGGRGRPRREAAKSDVSEANEEDEGLRFDPASLPPSIASTETEERPRRKPRKPKTTGGASGGTEGRDEKGGEELETVN